MAGSRKGTKAPRKSTISSDIKKKLVRKSINNLPSIAKDNNSTRKTRRRRGSLANREIHQQMKRTDCNIPLAPFRRLIRDIITDVGTTNTNEMRISSNAISALQEASETMLVQLMADAQLLALHANRVTLMGKDIKLLLQLQRPTFWTRK